MIPALLALSLLQAAEPVTLEKKARFSALVQELSRAAGCKLTLAPGIEDREIEVSIRGAGLYQALDALCRAHGGAGYFEPRLGGDGEDHPGIPIHPYAWVEYPSSYSGPFKVLVAHGMRRRLRAEKGERSEVQVQAALLAPPSIRIDWRGGARIEWSFAEARDADGKSVLPPPEETLIDTKVSLYSGLDTGLNLDETTVTLREFDLDRGLSILKGEATLTVPDTREIRIPLETGKEAVTPAGTVVVESVVPHGEDEWRILLKLRDPNRGARVETAFGTYGKVEHDWGWTYLTASPKERTIEARARMVRAKPGWIKLYAREGERTVKVPFEIKDVRFGKK